jgi:Peptidase A4 family
MFCAAFQGVPRQKGARTCDVSHHGRGAVQSTNWSGYATYASGVTFSDVKGSWTQPTATCNTTGHKYASFWVGIDGYQSSSVEQTGTDSDCSSQNHPSYYAWYEMYPAASVQISGFTVHPGDAITAEVARVGTTYTLTLKNTTTGQTFTTTKTQSGLANSSAEWVAEAPSQCIFTCRVLPLANFGTVNFTGSFTTGNGHAGSSSDATWSHDSITMATATGTVKAQPSALSPDGTAFSVTWKHS